MSWPACLQGTILLGLRAWRLKWKTNSKLGAKRPAQSPGLHYPVPRGRLFAGGLDVQRWATYGTGAGPSPQDVQRDIDLLAARQPQWVSLSPHDSSDEMIEQFRKTFGARYHELRVGEPQVIGGAP